MDDISVWNKTLSQSDVNSIYIAGPSDLNSHASATNLMAWWKFEDNGNDSATNSSNNLTVNSSSWYSSSAIAKKPTISLDFDMYNKLSIENITPTSTTLTDPNGSSFDIGTATDIYIEDTGTYAIETKDANTFALVSNVVSNIVVPTFVSGSPLSIIWATQDYSEFDASGGIATGTGSGVLVLNGTYDTLITSPYSGININLTGAPNANYNFRYKIPFKPKTQSFELRFTCSRNQVFQAYLGYLTLNWTQPEGWNTSGDTRQKVVNVYAEGNLVYLASFTGQSIDQSSYSIDYTKPFVITSDQYTLKLEHNGNSKSIDLTATHQDSNGNTVTDPEYYFWMSFHENTTSSLFDLSDIAYSINGVVQKNVPSLTHDGYNKLSIENITPTSTSLRLDSNTYDIGTATDIYIEDTGTYEIETKDVNTFALVSNVVGSVASPPSSTVNAGNFTLAFRHGTGTTDTSSNNCTLYSDMSTGDYDWGTVNSVSSTSTETTYNVTFSQMNNINYLVLAGGGGGGNDYPEGGGGGGGMLDGTETSIPGNTYDIVVGNGGTRRVNGTNSSFHTFTAVGGGAGLSGVGADGGSGGGGRDNSAGGSGVAGPPRQGYNGGTGYIIDYGSGGGGGGAGGNGGNAGNHVGGTGGTGRVWSFNNTRYGGGGGGGTRNSAGGSGGAGGGGNGGQRTADGSNGTNYLGGGGGCKANGGSGTVILNFDATQSSTPPRYFSFDTYNKLSIENITPTSTTLKYDSNTYDIGTATDIYIEDTGTYEIEAKSANTFAFASNVVSSVTRVEPVITGGYQFGHALTYDGKLYGWGENSSGELGVGDTTDKTVPTLCTGIPQGEIVSIWNQSIRGQSRWAKTRDGRIWVTGDHDSYCLPGSSSDFTTFTDVSVEFGDYTQTSNNVVWASGSERATQVLMENGDVWSFGDDTGSLGVLGQGASPTSDRTPRKLNVSNITKITYGGDLVLALDSSNVIWMWGRNQVGNSTLGWGPYNVPTNIMSTGTNSLTSLLATDSETVVDIESSYYSMFALTDKGTVYCTGHNASGQLGQGNATAKTSSDGWVKIEYFTSNAITVNKLYVGGGNPHVFADTSDGWYCWGENTTGELGLGDTTDKLSPVKFTGVSNIKKFGVGYLVSYAITEDGKYYAWGNGTTYARGDNTTGDITYPKYIDTLPNILAPSFEFDGYDKVLVNYPEVYKYDFYINVLSDDNLVFHEINFKDSTGASIKPLSYDKYNEIPVASWATGDMSGLFDGSTTSPPDFGFYKSDSSVDDKMFYVILPKLASSVVISHARPKYTPGFKIKVGTSVVFSEDSNGGTGETPAPYSKTCTLSTNVSKSQYTKYTKDTHTYDTNQAQIVTVSDPGTYDAQLSQDSVFALKSATVPATKASGLYTWAFHHGNFDNAYGDGDILTARDNGRFYADTPSYTGDIGTITGSKGVPGASTQYPTGGWLTSSTSTQYPSINNNGFITQFTNYYNGMNSDNYKILDNNDTTSTYAPSDQGCAFSYYNNSEKVYIEKVYVDFGTGQPESETIFLLEYANDVSTVTSSTSINSRDSSILKVINSRNVWEITVNKALWKFHIDCYNNGNNKMGCSPYSMYWTAYTLGEDDGTIYTFTPASTLTANVLMVAGGGSGGSYNTGGGGAGGLVYKQNESISTGVKTIVVGNGGEAIANSAGLRDGLPGKDTTFLGYTAIGGGAHGDATSDDKSGGSGGAGAGASSSDALQPTSTTGGFGNQGGTNDSDRAGGGGGGAGGAGENGDRNTKAGDGGIGKNYGYIFGTNYGENGWFAGGGGGGDSDQWHSAARGFGGKGGGGHGVGTFDTGQYGQSHTGGGGGGSGQDSLNTPNAIRGGGGGSGIVLFQTNVETPNVNSEVKAPKPDGFLVYNDNLDLVSRGPIPGSYNSNTVKTVKLPDGSEGPVYYSASGYTYFGVQPSNTIQGDGSFQTVESVFMPISTGYYTHIASLMYSDSNLMTLGIDGNNKLNIQHNNNVSHNAVTTLTTSDYVMEHGKWYHLVLTTDYLGNAKAYVNGYLVASERWSSMNSDKRQVMFYRIGVDNHPTRTFLTSTSQCYYSELNKKEVMQLAESVGLGPKLEYDGLNAINVVNAEPGSGTEITIYESNVNDTSNLYVVSCNESSYLLSNAGTYYAQIKGTDTFTITRPLTVTDDHFPLYQYPPIDGTTSGLTESAAADTWSTWTISGASNGNGQYQAKTTHAPFSISFTAYRAFNNDVSDDNGQYVDASQKTNVGLTLQLPSAKTIRKYRMYPVDHSLSSGAIPGSSTDPTLSGGDPDYKSRPKSWILKGSSDGTNWTDLDTVTNKPISIYGDVYSIDSPASYQYYQMFVVNIVDTSALLRIGEWQLWGDA
jgi:alpha-tubulin suppressor-like RCC1 family protein